MSWLDDLPEYTPTSVNDDLSFYDADTLTNKKGDLFRLRGFDAPEVEKTTAGGHSLGEAGGELSTEVLAGLANKQGYTNMKPIIGPDGKPSIGKFGRPLVDLFNEAGESFSDQVLKSGIADPSKYTSEVQNVSALLGQNERQRAALAGEPKDEWDQAAAKIEQGALQEGAKQLGFKQVAEDERELELMRGLGLGDQYVSTHTQIDNFDRDVNNKSLNPYTDS